MKAQGLSLRAIAAAMRAQGHQTSHVGVQGILKWQKGNDRDCRKNVSLNCEQRQWRDRVWSRCGGQGKTPFVQPRRVPGVEQPTGGERVEGDPHFARPPAGSQHERAGTWDAGGRRSSCATLSPPAGHSRAYSAAQHGKCK